MEVFWACISGGNVSIDVRQTFTMLSKRSTAACFSVSSMCAEYHRDQEKLNSNDQRRQSVEDVISHKRSTLKGQQRQAMHRSFGGVSRRSRDPLRGRASVVLNRVAIEPVSA